MENSSFSNDETKVRFLLSQIILDQGISIIHEPRRVKGLLNDYCQGNYKREINILIILQDENVPQELIRNKDEIPYDISSLNIRKKILLLHAFDEIFLQWAIDSWGIALNLISDKEATKLDKIQPGDSSDYVQRGKKFNGEQLFFEAIAELENALKLDPNDPIALREMGYALSGLKNYNQALECYSRSIELDDQDDISWRHMGYTLSRIEKNNDAIYCFDKAIRINPRDPITWRRKGVVCHKIKKYSDAIQCFDAAIKNEPQGAINYILLSKVYHDIQQYQNEIKALNHSISIDSSSVWAWNRLGWAHVSVNNFKDALDCFEKILEIDSNNQSAWKGKNLCQKKLSQHQREITFLIKEVQNNPHSTYNWNKLGWAYAGINDFDEALKCFKKSLSLDPTNSTALKGQSLCEKKLGQHRIQKSQKNNMTNTHPDKPKGIFKKLFHF